MSIRLRYTGLVRFGTNVLSLITGLIFVTIVARSLSQTDIGLWFFIDTNVAIFIMLRNMIPFWLTRSYARGKDVVSTGIFANLLLSIPFFLGYVIILPFFKEVWLSPLHFGFASSFIFLHYIISSLTALVSAHNPEKLAYSLVIGELFKLAGYPLIINYQLLGVITVTAISYIAKIVYLFSLLKPSKKIELTQIKVWINSSWVLILGLIGITTLQNLNKYILGLFSLESLGVYSIYYTITSKILIANTLASGLYPKLLSGQGKSEDVQAILSLTMMFSIPMTIGGIILSRDLVSILGSKYLHIDMANEILYILFIVAFIKVLENVFRRVALGLEHVDMGVFNWKDVLKSKIFTSNIIPYAGLLVGAPLSIILIPLYGLISVASIQLVTVILLCVLRYTLAQKSINFDIPVRRVLKYCIAAVVMVAALLVLPRGMGSIVVILEVLFGFIIYIASLIAIDVEARELVLAIISEIKSLVKRNT